MKIKELYIYREMIFSLVRLCAGLRMDFFKSVISAFGIYYGILGNYEK